MFPAVPFIPPPGHAKYSDLYADPSRDPFQGNFLNLYNEYDSTGAGIQTTSTIRDRLYRNGNSRIPMHILVHVSSGGGPTDPGLVVCYHRLTRHETPFGQVVQPYDLQGHAFVGDTQGGQAPITVAVPDALFEVTAPLTTPTLPRLVQLLNEDPAVTAVGPFLATDADVEPLVVRLAIPVPNRYARLLMGAGHTPRMAFLAVGSAILADNNEIACKSLLDWFRATLTRTAGAVPVTLVPPLAPPSFADPTVMQSITSYRLDHVHHDLPALHPTAILQGASLVGQGLTQVAEEQRLTRLEARVARDTKSSTIKRLPSQLYGPKFLQLLRVAHAANEADLLQVHTDLANPMKGTTQRAILQNEVEEQLLLMAFDADFPISTALTQKVVQALYSSTEDTNLSQGVHLMNVGQLDQEARSFQRQLNDQSDTILNGAAAPSLQDVVTVSDNSKDVSIPRDMDELRFLLQRCWALWAVLFGRQHPLARAYLELHNQCTNQAYNLRNRIGHTSPQFLPLLAPYLARWVQIETNTWFKKQRVSDVIVSGPDLVAVLDKIEATDHWLRPFPSRYMQTYLQALPGPPSVGPPTLVGTVPSSSSVTSAVTFGTTPTGLSSTTPQGHPQSQLPAQQQAGTNQTTRNPSFDERFRRFRNMGIKSADFRTNLRRRNVDLPSNAQGNLMCIAYHLKGLCNVQCFAVADHRPHTAGESQTLEAFCNEHYRIVPFPPPTTTTPPTSSVG